jgi:plasmid rolling circle replication initiator protein Rep
MGKPPWYACSYLLNKQNNIGGFQLMRDGVNITPSDIFYLTEVSPKDKPWDKHRSQSATMKSLYFGGLFEKYSERIGDCSRLLQFDFLLDGENGESKLRLSAAHFCRVRHCPVCQWRRSLMWRARFFDALPKIIADYPKLRFLFLTLTVRNCEVQNLRETITGMNKSWRRLSQRRQFPAVGWLKSLEVTRSTLGEAHPHFHAILAVNLAYFHHGYLSHEKWVALWRESLRVDYDPSVNVKAIYSKPGSTGLNEEIMKAVCETLKYSLKPEDLTSDRQWLEAITTQLHKTRAVGLGGIFKTYMSEEEPEDLIGKQEDSEDSGSLPVWFSWEEALRRYCKTSNNSDFEN